MATVKCIDLITGFLDRVRSFVHPVRSVSVSVSCAAADRTAPALVIRFTPQCLQ